MEDSKVLPEATPAETLKAERERIAEIEATASRFVGRVVDINKLKDAAVQNGSTVEQFKGAVLEALPKGQPMYQPDSALGLTRGEVRKYSIKNVILHQMAQRGLIAASAVDASREIEYSQAIQKNLGTAPRGLYIPFEVQESREKLGELSARTVQTVGSATVGGNLVGTDLMADQFIELLRNKSLAGVLGVKMLPGLNGNVAIPKQTGAGTATWVTEGNAVSATNITIGQVTLSPKTVGAYVDFSRQLLMQSTPAIDGLVQADLEQVLMLAIDHAIFHGSGSPQPVGIVGVSGVGSATGANLAYEDVWANFWSDIAVANAESSNLKFVMGTAAFGLLNARARVTNYPSYILENGLMGGLPAVYSNQIDAGYLFLGDFTTVMLGEWGVLDILVDPYTASTTGTVRIVAFKSVDVGVRQAGALTFASDLS